MFSTESSFTVSNFIVTTTLCLSLSLVPARADDLTMMIEEHLASLGYDAGTVDGEADVKTAVAISQFQAEKGLEVTGVVSPQLAGILAAEADKGMTSAAATAQASPVTQTSSSATETDAAQQACLQQKIAAAQQAQPKKKKGLGGAFSSLAKAVGKYGGDDVAKASAEILEAGATVNDLAEAARELGISESDIADCQPSAGQVAGAPAVGGVASPAATAAQPSGQNVRYAEQGAFQGGSYTLGQIDATLEACTGVRPGYRAEVDTLVTEAHASYRAEALSLYDSRYQSMSQTLGSALSGTCPDAQLASLRRQADVALEGMRPKVLPSAPAVQSAAVSTAPVSAGSGAAISNTSTSPSQSVSAAADTASLRIMRDHCAVMAAGLSSGLYGVGKSQPRDRHVGIQNCSSSCKGAFEYSLERSRQVSDYLVNRTKNECSTNYNQAVAEYRKVLSDFDSAFSNYAALRQQALAAYAARGIAPEQDRLLTVSKRKCEQAGGQDCDAFAMCSIAYQGAKQAPPCGIFFYGSGNNSKESLWEKVRDSLIANRDPINFANMSAALPPEMTRVLIAEGAAFESDCDQQESFNQNKLRNCGCYRSVYLDERVKAQRFASLAGNQEFNQGVLGSMTWAQCINEDGVRDYVMRGCMQQGVGRGPETEAAYKAYCQCQLEPTLNELKILTEYGNSNSIIDANMKAMQACQDLRP